MSNLDSQIEFIKHSIDDIQSTIRAIDTKAAAVIAILLAPLTEIGSISNYLIVFLNKFICPWIFISILFVFVFIVSWAISFYASVRVIGAIDNPSDHVTKINSCNGVFYSGGIFPTNAIDVFTNRKSLLSTRNLDTQITLLPSNNDEIVRELSFEQMKLVYIREIKIHRLNFSINVCILWLVTGLIMYSHTRFF